MDNKSLQLHAPPQKPNMTMENQPIEDVFPIENGGFSIVILKFPGSKCQGNPPSWFLNNIRSSTKAPFTPKQKHPSQEAQKHAPRHIIHSRTLGKELDVPRSHCTPMGNPPKIGLWALQSLRIPIENTINTMGVLRFYICISWRGTGHNIHPATYSLEV